MRPRLLLLGVLFGVGFSLAGCDRPGCDGKLSQDANAPLITNLEIVGNYPDDPWTLVLAIDYVKASPTLNKGAALFYIGASTEPLRLPLQQPFLQAGLPDGAASGRLGMLFPLNSGLVQDGDVLRLGVKLEDGSPADATAADPNGARSNCYSMDLNFNVQPVKATAQLLRRAGRGLRHWWP